MRYVFAKEKITLRVTVEPGGIYLHFMPDEQSVSYAILNLLTKIYDDDDLRRVVKLLRTEHTKEEEN